MMRAASTQRSTLMADTSCHSANDLIKTISFHYHLHNKTTGIMSSPVIGLLLDTGEGRGACDPTRSGFPQ
eukprot:scaffold24186_cov33-Attheya_sp.AAC.1